MTMENIQQKVDYICNPSRLKIDDLDFACVPNSMRRQLWEKLEVNRNWEYLAEKLGFTTDRIYYIKDLSTKVKTEELFCEYEQHQFSTIGRVLDALLDLELYKIIDIFLDKDNVQVILSSVSRKVQICTPENATLSVSSKQKGPERKRVFVTYAIDSLSHLRRVMKLCECLRRNNFLVSVDECGGVDTAEDVGHYHTTMERYERAQFVIVCISPWYHQEVTKSHHEYKHIEQCSDIPQPMYTHAIYQRILQELQVCSTDISTRIIPVLFTRTGAGTSHVPLDFQNVSSGQANNTPPLYYWPANWKHLLHHLIHPDNVSLKAKYKYDIPEEA